MKYPNKHGRSSFFGGYIKLKSGPNVKKFPEFLRLTSKPDIRECKTGQLVFPFEIWPAAREPLYEGAVSQRQKQRPSQERGGTDGKRVRAKRNKPHPECLRKKIFRSEKKKKRKRKNASASKQC
jgi:hypothetical protein